MKYTYCIPAALALALLLSGPGMAEEKTQAAVTESPVDLNGKPIKGKAIETMNSG
jgi:hypothetical protein